MNNYKNGVRKCDWLRMTKVFVYASLCQYIYTFTCMYCRTVDLTV